MKFKIIEYQAWAVTYAVEAETEQEAKEIYRGNKLGKLTPVKKIMTDSYLEEIQ